MLADHQRSHYHHHYHYRYRDHCHPNRHPLFSPPSDPFCSSHRTHLSPPPAVFSTGGRINIHLGPYTGLVSVGVSGRAVWRLQTQWPTTESRETTHSCTPRASKDHPFNTNAHIPAHAEREGGLREKVVEEWAGTMRGLQMDVERGEVTEKWKSGEIHKHEEREGSL